AVSGSIAHRYGWRPAFYIAALPGLVCALLALMIYEPRRGAAEAHDVGAKKRDGSPFLLVLSIPTMWWVIASGALHNFNMYALGQFLSPFLQRFHGQDIRQAGFIAMVVYGLSGIPGLIAGGVIGDAAMKRKPNGRLVVATIFILAAVPLEFMALGRGPGEIA